MHISIIGPNNVGKTTYINRIRTGQFNNNECDKSEYEHSIKNTYVTMHIYDHLVSKVDGIILMFDVTAPSSYETIKEWYNVIADMKVPIVVCGNKVDEKTRLVMPKSINFPKEKNLKYYDLSCKSNYNFYKPVDYLLLRYFKDNLKI